MRKLKIWNFSCISEADIALNRLTVLIGPQASGKSVISKLFFFFFDLTNLQRIAIESGKDFDGFKALLKAKFVEQFPVSAWGDRKFVIWFQSGSHEFKLTRITYNDNLSDNIRVSTSSALEAFYKVQFDAYKKLSKRVTDPESGEDVDAVLEFRSIMVRGFTREQGSDFVAAQTFIPAGRAFFTNMGRAIAAFEQSRLLDPLTVRFARLYTLYLDRYKGTYSRRLGSLREELLGTSFEKLLGGKLITSDEGDYVTSPDGRRIPFSALSSGQQELLPLFVTLNSLSATLSRRGRLVYIEEPEAHLFPEAQSELVELLGALVQEKSLNTDLILTTHSPYVLSKLNNLMFGGDIARRSTNNADAVAAILPAKSLLRSSVVNAYAIKDGVVQDIKSRAGLVNAEYLDSISGKIAEEFDALLEIEAE
ncbi:AAA family ATPase [Burkholderia pseudomallei]|uniref:AAA family ATPase n=1 Tax=Burkholderia pseudomallei TaxID=28450 RepID=UPI002DBC7FC5|nr:AAA family ATPase [Burkholderia pseudomallei]MEB5483292.1 AAA family ATPase [Burkholderia pseudomallei]MEB5490153.1 AAA family ATPase [Burkholderia pseudomallei]MEB5496543.1 AAA family ATPase [Burkholderia pseudomallei]MEB5502023.1 AAA family ATPase [Burkholderia pseudomallei]MEB5509267.1 AAA family ATPase [Burkholderia pseudomallei]